MTVGLGIIDTDLCLWASSATPEMVQEAILVPGHPVVKAKPAPVVPGEGHGWLCRINEWANSNPILAAVAVAGGYLLLRRK